MTYKLIIWFVLVTYLPGQERQVHRVQMDEKAPIHLQITTCASMVSEHALIAAEGLPNDAKQVASCEVSKDKLL